jgi:large subunit ribosomal protein L10
MKKERKTELVGELSERFGRASLALVSEYKGITAAESTELRRRLRAVRGELRVSKNTLIRKAIDGTPFSKLDEKLGGPIGIVLSFEDPVAVAKAITSFKEAGDKLKLRGGVLDGRPLTAEEVQALANMPPKEVVMAQLLGLLQAPASRLVRLLNEPGSALARVIDAVGKKNGGGIESAPPEESAPAGGGESPPAADAQPAAEAPKA